MKKLKVLLLFGGQSAEHEVSVISARSVCAAIDPNRYDVLPVGIGRSGQWCLSESGYNPLDCKTVLPEKMTSVHLAIDSGELIRSDNGRPVDEVFDIVFPLLHGPNGEDGTVQGLLELAGLPYVGAGVAASAVGMDKELARAVFMAKGLAQTDYLVVHKSRWQSHANDIIVEIEDTLAYPLFVKPVNLGSSIGISKATDRDSLEKAIQKAACYDIKIMVERSVELARELECAVLGNERPQASTVGEIVPGAEFYDYSTKYLDDRSQLIVPADLPDAISEKIKEMSIEAFRAVDGAGLSRVDFLMSPSGDIMINEINTMPGFTPISMYPRLWEASGTEYPRLIDKLIELGLARYHQRSEVGSDVS
ncbi:MAG: D-alanine--D-alanine ligase [Proteobacteria bacterium]|nr:D-alanine--D-alanine ligase [Pseudomonadota bacterium]